MASFILKLVRSAMRMDVTNYNDETLGKRHSAINARTNAAVQLKTAFEDIEKAPEKTDADRLHKIDVASKYRNVPYILSNLKSEDDLYVSRALKKSTWLFSDALYADIINPEYLEAELFPSMTSRAVAKTLLHIRLNLKDENRCELFYKYYDEKDRVDDAMKWLPKCSVAFIEQKVQNWQNIETKLFKRLCERSVKVFEFIMKKRKDNYGVSQYFQAAIFILNTHPEEFLNAFEDTHHYSRPKLNKHATKILIVKCLHRFQAKIETYIRHIDLAELGKRLGPSATKELIVKLAKMKELDRWFNYNNVKPLVETLPLEGKFEFVKHIFVEKTVGDEDEVSHDMCSFQSPAFAKMKIMKRSAKSVNVSNVYQWYQMAPFPVAFAELKKLIRTESSPDERFAMLQILVASAGKNMDNIYIVLQYFREKHINEPAKFKATFVGSLLSSTKAYNYDDRTWKLLDEILHSLEFYTEEDNFWDLHKAIYAYICRSLIKKTPILEVIRKKFMNNFSTLKKVQKHLSEAEKDIVYNYLRSEMGKKLQCYSAKNKQDYEKVTSILKNILELNRDWNKDITQDAQVMKVVKELVEVRCTKNELEIIYDIEKKWRRGLFDYSLELAQREDVYINVLKHKPSMILRHRAVLDHVIKQDTVNFKKVLQKLRIYFPDTIGQQCLEFYKEKLEKCRTERVGYQAVCLGICVLMEKDNFKALLTGFVPENYKIQWSEEDGALINIRKYLAQQMFFVRPTPDIDTVLLFAKGDYLQYILPSLISICSRKSSEEYRKALPALIGGAVSLQKHGIRLAFAKLTSEEIISTCNQLWGSTKNASIRAVLYTLTFDMLKREKNSNQISVLWTLLKSFTEKLTAEEDRTVYAKLATVGQIPESVRGEFCMMSYKLLNSLPPKLNCQDLAKRLIREINYNIDNIDEDFITDLLSNYILEVYEKRAILKGRENSYGNNNDMTDLVAKYIICCKNESTQMKRYEVIFKKITKHSLSMWTDIGKDNIKPRMIYMDIVENLVRTAKNELVEQGKEYVNSLYVFEQILEDICILPFEENYTHLTVVKLAKEYCLAYKTVQKNLPVKMETDDSIEERDRKHSNLVSKIIGKEFGIRCLAILKDDIETHFASISSVFGKTLRKFIEAQYSANNSFTLGALETFTADSKDIEGNILAIKIFPTYLNHCEEDIKKEFSNIRQKFIENENREIKLLYHSMSFDD